MNHSTSKLCDMCEDVFSSLILGVFVEVFIQQVTSNMGRNRCRKRVFTYKICAAKWLSRFLP